MDMNKDRKKVRQLKNTTSRISIFSICTILLMVGAAGVAFAEFGSRYGGHATGRFGTPRMGSGYDGRLPGSGPAFGQQLRSYGTRNSLTDQREAGIKAADDIFRWQNKDLRRRLDDRQIILHREKTKLRPDHGRVLRLQRQIDDIQSELDSKTLQHRLEMLNNTPERYRSIGGD